MIYTVQIDTRNPDPKESCKYQNDSLFIDNWENVPIFKQIRPCAFYQGQVLSYINKNNFLELLTPVKSSIDFDIMIEFPYFGYQIYKENSYIYVSITDEYNKKYFCYNAFSRNYKSDLANFYQGAYKGYIDQNNKLRSIIGVHPSNYYTFQECNIAAKKQGQFYSQSLFSHITAIQCLYIIKYKNLNGQQALGKGYCEAQENTDNNTAKTGGTVLFGMNYGDPNNGLVQIKLFGIEDFWGNIWEWVDGIKIDNNYNIITLNNIYNVSNDIIFRKPTNSPHGYIKDVFGTNELGFIPKEWTEQNLGYWSNYGCLFPNSVLHFGDRWCNGNRAGPFRFGFHGNGDIHHRTFGCRLCYH